MRKLLFFLLLGAFAVQVNAQNVSTGPAIYPPSDPNWKLINSLSDEFNGTELDVSKWNTQFNWLQDSIMTTYPSCSDSVISKHEGASYFKTDGDYANHVMKTDPDGTKYLSLVTRQESYKGMVWDWPYSQVVPAGTAVELSALSPTGFAHTKWYDQKLGGNLLGTGIITTAPIHENTVFWAETAAGSNRMPVVVQIKGFNDPQGKQTYHELTKPWVNSFAIDPNSSNNIQVISGGNIVLEAKGGNANDFRWYDVSGNFLGSGRWYTITNVLVNTKIRLNNIHTPFYNLDNITYTEYELKPVSTISEMHSMPAMTIVSGTKPVFYVPGLEYLAESNGSANGMDFQWTDEFDNVLGAGIKYSPPLPLTQPKIFKLKYLANGIVHASTTFKVEIENPSPNNPTINQTKPIPVNFKPTWHIDYADFDYTTARIVSKKAIRYGYFEIRCRMSQSLQTGDIQGIGPNFWLWGTKSGSSNLDDNLKGIMTEIDIFEFVSDNWRTENIQESYAGGHNIHYRAIGNNLPIDAPFELPNNETSSDFDMTNNPGWHTYGAEWQPDFVQFYIDGQPTSRLNRGKVKIALNKDWNNIVEMDFDPANMCFMNMIADVNTSVVTTCEMYGANTVFPHFYDIDYIRVYQLRNMCDGQFIRNNPINASQYTPKVWQNIELNKGVFTFNPNQKTVMRASEGINIQPELYYPVGSELILIPTECSLGQGNFKNGLGAFKKHQIPEPPTGFYSAKLKKY